MTGGAKRSLGFAAGIVKVIFICIFSSFRDEALFPVDRETLLAKCHRATGQGFYRFLLLFELGDRAS